MTDVPSKLVDAYRINPILTGLLILNIGTFIGMGWYIDVANQRMGKFVMYMLDEQKQLYTSAIDMAKTCGARR